MGDQGSEKDNPEDNSIADWEVIEEAPLKDASPSSDISNKPAPPAVKERASPSPEIIKKPHTAVKERASPSPEIVKKPHPAVKERASPSPEIVKKPHPAVKERASPSPEIVKKPPPVVKGKPRKAAESSEKGVLASAQMSSLTNVLQKGPLKPKVRKAYNNAVVD